MAREQEHKASGADMEGQRTGPDIHLEGDVSGSKFRQPNSSGCFICGLNNPIGLKMVFEEDRECELVYARLSIPEMYRSYPGVVHGGIVATVLDETSGRALIVHTGERDLFFATARMEVKYRRATPTGTPLVAVGWVERMSTGRALVCGELRLEQGPVVTRQRPRSVVLAECRSLVVQPPSGFLDQWEQEVPFWRVYSDREIERARVLDSTKGLAL